MDLLIPQPVPLSHVLSEFYRSFMDDLVATLNDKGASSRTSDERHDVVDAIAVRDDEANGEHTLRLVRRIVEMLNAATPADGTACAGGADCSLNLVAGA